MPGLLRWTCGDYARVLYLSFARETAGAAGTRHSLRPLFCWANGFCKNSGGSRRGNAEAYLASEIVLAVRMRMPSLRANGSRECAPDDRLREAIQSPCGL